MDPQQVPPTSSTQVPLSNEPSLNLIGKFKYWPKKLKLLFVTILVIIFLIIASVLIYFKGDESYISTDQPSLPPDVIAQVGESNVYQNYLDKELKFYPATKSAEVKEQLKQKVINDQIALIEAKKEGIISDFEQKPVLTDEEYLARAKQLSEIRIKVEEGRDSLSGSLISIGFFQGENSAQAIERNKQLAFSKISPLYEQVKSGAITLEQVRQTLASDSVVRRLDPNIAVNVQTRFNNKKGNQITYWKEFDEMLWATQQNGFTPLYIGKTADSNNNPVEAVYVFGYVFSKSEGKNYDSYQQWLEQKVKLYNLQSTSFYKINLPASLFSLVEVSADYDSGYSDPGGDTGGSGSNGGNGGDGNLSNQNHTLDNPDNTCYGCDGPSGPPPEPILAPSWAGTVYTETGALLPGALINITCTTGSTSATTGTDGNYNAPAVQSINYRCNPINLKASYGGITCEEKQVTIPNSTAVQYNNFTCNLGVPACNKPCPGAGYCEGAADGCTTCRPNASGVNVCQLPPACGTDCTQNSDCAGAKDGCTACLPNDSGTGKVCRQTPACNVSCTRDDQCAGAGDGCVSCLPSDSGAGKVCRPAGACNVSCTQDGQCIGAKDGCTACLPSDTGGGNVCRPAGACNVACTKDSQCAGAKDGCSICSGGTCKAPACGVSCSQDSQCAGAKDGCTSCLPGDGSSGNVCRPTPACGVSCTKDSQCAGARDGCSACVSGVCKIPPACGVACTSRADCAGAKDGCSECLEGTCTDYTDNMCKCDGLTAELNYPDDFKFEAFGKVDGKDAKKAEIADITFRLTRDNVVVAKSNPITPTIVQNDSTKVRFKANWTTPPPQVTRGATYRVFADVRCKPKKIAASNGELASSSQQPQPVKTEIVNLPPKGLVWIVNTISNLFNGGKVNPIVTEVLAQLSSPSPNSTSGQSLQLSTLNFVKLMDTDNCRFVMFKFDETLF